MKKEEEEFKVEDTAMDRDRSAHAALRRKGHPSHAVHGLTALEQKRVDSRRVNGKGKVVKAKRYDGRALKLARPRNDKVMRAFYEEVDLPEFKSALEMSADPKFQMLLFAIGSPRLSKCSFAEICRRCNLTINDISAVWRNHQLQRGMMRMMNHMPEIMEDTAEDARTRVVVCARCAGTGKLDGETINKQKDPVCPECHGDGKTRILGDKDSRQLVFESAGLKKGASQTQVNVNVGAVPSMEQVIEDAERALDVPFTNVTGGSNGEATGGEAGPSQGDRKEAGQDSADSGAPGADAG